MAKHCRVLPSDNQFRTAVAVYISFVLYALNDGEIKGKLYVDAHGDCSTTVTRPYPATIRARGKVTPGMTISKTSAGERVRPETVHLSGVRVI